MDWNFAPAWPRVAALAAAAVLGISIGLSGLGTRIAADLDLVRVAAADEPRATCSISIGAAAMTMTHRDPGSLLALAADRLARAQPVLHRHDRHAGGAPLRRAGAAGRDRASAHRGGAHRAARRAAARRRCRETARGIPRARSRGRRGAREGLNRAFERIQAALRAQPFDAAQLRAALAEVRAARPVYEQAMQEIYRGGAARCRRRAARSSPTGRRRARTRADRRNEPSVEVPVTMRPRERRTTDADRRRVARSCARAAPVRLHADRRCSDRAGGRHARRNIARRPREPHAALPAPDWWRGFRSRELTTLVERAYLANLDIAAAVARIEQADAQTRIAGAPLLPAIDFDGTAQRARHRRRRAQHAPRRAQRELRDRLLGQEPRGAALGGIRRDREPLRPRGDRALDRRERHQHLFPGPRRTGPAAHRARECPGGDPHPRRLSGAHRGRHRDRPRHRAAGIAAGAAARRASRRSISNCARTSRRSRCCWASRRRA